MRPDDSPIQMFYRPIKFWTDKDDNQDYDRNTFRPVQEYSEDMCKNENEQAFMDAGHYYGFG